MPAASGYYCSINQSGANAMNTKTIADTIKIAQVKPRIVSRHLINLSRLCMADYVAKPLENGLDGEIGAIYFLAAHGIEEIHMYEQMAECFCIYGDE
jgi:hypothetical protein